MKLRGKVVDETDYGWAKISTLNEQTQTDIEGNFILLHYNEGDEITIYPQTYYKENKKLEAALNELRENDKKLVKEYTRVLTNNGDAYLSLMQLQEDITKKIEDIEKELEAK